LDCQDEVWTRFLESMAEQVSDTDQVKRLAHSGADSTAVRSRCVRSRDRHIRLLA
jgi:hypothetical protein